MATTSRRCATCRGEFPARRYEAIGKVVVRTAEVDPWSNHNRHRTHPQQLRKPHRLEVRKARRHDHPGDRLSLQQVEDLVDGVGTRGRDGLDVVSVPAQPACHLVEVDQPSHRHVDVLRVGKVAQRLRRAPVECEQQRDGLIVGGQNAEAAFAVGARRINEDQCSRHEQGFVHGNRVRGQGFATLAAR